MEAQCYRYYYRLNKILLTKKVSGNVYLRTGFAEDIDIVVVDWLWCDWKIVPGRNTTVASL